MATERRDRFGAAGIGVSDLARSVDFYTRVIGMRKLTTLKLPDMDEVILGFSSRQTALVLMHYTDGSNPRYDGNPGKLVFSFADPHAAADRIRAEGLEIVREVTPVPELGDALVGFGRDPDGILLELLQAPTPEEA
jgi:lactoylglutathione lyase